MIDAPQSNTPPPHVSHTVDVKPWLDFESPVVNRLVVDGGFEVPAPPPFEREDYDSFRERVEVKRVDVHNVITSPLTRTVRPCEPAGDAFFGLEPGTNGSAATARRALVQPEGYRWLRHDGRPATGLQLVPSSDDNGANPWDARGRW